MTTRGVFLLLGCLVTGIGVSHCGGDSEGSGSKGNGDAGEPGSGGTGKGGAGKGGTSGSSGSAGKGGTSGSSGKGGAGLGGSAGAAGAPEGGAGDGGSPDTGGQGGQTSGCTQTAPSGTQVMLAQATATFSQTLVFNCSVAQIIDGITNDDRGWAIAPSTAATIGPQTAALETATNTGAFTGGTRLTFRLVHNYDFTGDHALGRFRISVTTADRATFADGNDGTATPGDVGADGIWSPLAPVSACALGGIELTTLRDSSILAEVNHIVPMEYVVVAETRLTGITGVRIEALEDASLPQSGPGLQASNGNFLLSEFEMFAEAP